MPIACPFMAAMTGLRTSHAVGRDRRRRERLRRVGRAAGRRGCRERLAGRRQIGSGAERVAGTRDHHRSNGVGPVAVGVGTPEAVAHRRRERVPSLGSIERDDGDAVPQLERDVDQIGHRCHAAIV